MNNLNDIFDNLYKQVKTSNKSENKFDQSKIFNDQILSDLKENIKSYAKVHFNSFS